MKLEPKIKGQLILELPELHAEIIEPAKPNTDQKQAEEALRISERFARDALDALSEHIAILDEEGRIITVNEAWCDFARKNSASVDGLIEGADYLGVCEAARGPDAEQALAFAEGIRTVMRGEGKEFMLEYSCHSPWENRWFIGRVTRFRGEGPLRIVISHQNITKRKLAEEATEHSEALLRAVLDQMPSGVTVRDAAGGEVVLSNARSREIFGPLAENVEQFSAYRAFHPDGRLYRADEWPLARSMAAGEAVHAEEIEYEQQDGTRIAVSISAAPIRDSDGQIVMGVGTFHDITRRKRREEILRLRLALVEFSISHSLEELLQKTLDEVGALTDSPIGFYHFVEDDQETLSLQAWSTRTVKEFCKAEGKGLHYMISQAGVWVDCVHEKKPVIHNDYLALPHRKGLPEGHAAIVRELVVPIMRSGRVVAILGVGNKPRDYTEQDVEITSYLADVAWEIANRKRAEEALSESEEKYRKLHESMMDGVVYIDMEGRIKDFNESYRQMLGYSKEELLQLNYLDLTPQCWHSLEHGIVKDQVLLRGYSEVYEKEYRKKDGTVFPVELRTFLIRDASGENQGIWGIVRDITERKRAEETLKQAEEKYRSIFENAAEGIFQATVDGKYLSVNPALARMCGYESSEVMMTTITDIATQLYVNPEDRGRAKALYDSVGEIKKFETQYRHTDGRSIWVSMNSSAIRDGHGNTLYYEGTIENITELKRSEEERTLAEAQLRQAQKMEALGTLAGGIAHDFNNILGIIVGYTEMAQMNRNDGSQLQENLFEVLKAAGRAKDLVQQILAFSRMSEQERKPMQIELIVKEALKMLRASLPSTIDIHQKVSSESVILADPTQIHQVLMNLCTNAAYAMRESGGVLEVSLADVHLGPECRPPQSELQPGPYVELTVSDTGHGIDQAILARIFDPFFTTKDKGVGTGLGLAVVHGIVSDCGGTIEVESLPGNGSTFKVLFPAVERTPVPSDVEASLPPRGRERILVVDDEFALARVLKKRLEHLGYEVTSLTSGVEALELFGLRLRDRPFDLVVTDMTMPRVTGIDLVKGLQKLQPNLSAILCTGFSEKVDAERVRALGIQGLLMKPVIVKDLAQMIRKVLNERVT